MAPPFLTASNLSDASGITHGFFGRRGGVSTGIYESLNAGGRGTGDTVDLVDENRARIARAMGCTELLSVYQIHSPDVVTVTGAWTSWDDRPQADSMVTRTPGLGLCILAADCTPVLFADTEAGVIGAAHAGWKGANAGVLEATVERMVSLGAARARIVAALGPCIRQPSYEVGPEFREAILARHADAESLFIAGRGDRFQFDQPGLCIRALRAAGVTKVEDLCRDTCAEEAEFFSNRRRNLRGEPDYGRNASVIVLKA